VPEQLHTAVLRGRVPAGVEVRQHVVHAPSAQALPRGTSGTDRREVAGQR
jgi:hypothetical protein